VSRFLTAHQNNYAIQCHSCWKCCETQENTQYTQIKYNLKKASTEYIKTKLLWFSRLLWHSARKWCGLNSTVLPSPHGAYKCVKKRQLKRRHLWLYLYSVFWWQILN